jgi:HlyD family secretion protein
MNRRTKIYGVVLVAICAGIGVRFGFGGKPQEAIASVAAMPVLTVTVVEAQRKTLDDNINVVGAIVPRENVVVIAELTGRRIREVYADVGDSVRKGQKLALLDSESLHIQTQGLQSEYERTRDEYGRIQTMLSSGAVSRELASQKQAAFEVARSHWEDAKLSVQRALVVAPTDGLIYQRSAAIGGLTNGNDPLFSIAKDGEVEMEASVPEAMVGRLKPSLPVALEVAGSPAREKGSVRLITPRVDSASRTAGVRIRFSREDAAPVGAFCEASITLAQVGGLMLPGAALQQDTRGPYVWTVGAENKVVRTPVTVVTRTPDGVLVDEAIGTARVVAKAGSFLKDGDIVTVAKGG